jgi:FkbH-like protein
MAPPSLESLRPATRRRIARRLKARRHVLAAGWADRHAGHPLLAARATDALGSWDAYRETYVLPLLAVLRLAVRDASVDHLHVYAAERLRYYDPPTLRDGGRAELAALLDADLEDLVAVLEPTDAALARTVLGAVHAALTAVGAEPLRIGLVGDCLLSEIASFVAPKARAAGVDVELHQLYFSAAQRTALSTEELVTLIARERFHLLALSFLTYEGIPPYTALLAEADRLPAAEIERRVDQLDALIRDYVAQVREATDAPILLHGVSGLPLTRRRRALRFLPPLSRGRRTVVALLDARLRELNASTENMVLVDERAIVSAVGARAASRRLVSRLVTRRGLFHPSALGGLLAAPYVELAVAYRDLAGAKVLLVDFDNTLWHGVMAEGAVEHERDAQRLLKRLKEAGVLLVALSKNDPRSIRWDELELDYDDFVMHKVSWDPKPQAVQEAAHQLDLDPKSFVLIDDSPVERELVRQQLPQVRSMDPADPATWRRLALMLELPNTRPTAEAARRTELYREAARRRDALSGGADFGAMMGALDLRVGLRPARREDLDRVHELVDRTSQFNTTTVRRSRQELAALLDDERHHVFVGTLGDKFGDLGVVGVTVVRREADVLHLDAVIMSCRAMGFGFERVLVRGPLDALAAEATSVVGRYVPTARNGPCASLFADLGFSAVDAATWRLDLRTDALPEVPDWLRIGEPRITRRVAAPRRIPVP